MAGEPSSVASFRDIWLQRRPVANPSLDDSWIREDRQFSLVTYNILAECHRVRGDYSFTDEQYLVQNYRHELLWRELKYLDADIVCLQEVNPQYYNTTLQPAMLKLGYSGHFIKRTLDYFDEGEATFVKTARFSVESWAGVSLTELMKKRVEDLDLDSALMRRVLDYVDMSEVINICRLRCKRTSKTLTVGNVHIVWDDLKWPDIKTLEIASAVKELVSQAGSDSSPHIFCGDFNSVPTSVGYQLAQDGYLSDSNIASLQAVENLKLQTGSKSLVATLPENFQHTSRSLTSAYVTCQGHEPEVTCYDTQSWGCLDYIWYNQSGLVVRDVLAVPTISNLKATGGLPNQYFPSDHLSLKAKFVFK